MKIDHLQLKTTRLSALRAFYTDTFDCSVTTGNSEAFTVEIGTTEVTFSAVDDGSDPFYHFAINIPQNQFDDATTWLADRVDLLVDADTGEREFFSESWNTHQVYCLDSADNIVELIARHDLANDAERPFGSENFRRVSEIGLPVPDNRHAVRVIGDNAGVSLYSGDDTSTVPEDESFTAVGDDYGMFIVVEQGRQWFPTRNQAAEVHPITVGLSDATGEYTFPDLPYRIYPSQTYRI